MAAVAMCFFQYEAILAIKMTKIKRTFSGFTKQEKGFPSIT